MLYGVDRISEYDSLFCGKRVGLITSPSAVNSNGVSDIDVFFKEYCLSALYSPEHGVRGNAQAGAVVPNEKDDKTGVPIYSLYRKDSKHMTEEMLCAADIVVYDIQDVGTRYYTFLYTMLYAMQDCTLAGKPFVVLDRPNPLGGVVVEGNVLRYGYRSFVGGYPLCMRYGLTVGEFAQMANEEWKIGCDLHVIKCKEWLREQQFPDYGSVWIPPSLNLPHFEAALLYPGTCLLEGTCISEGRGTATPFEVAGAPFLDAQKLSDSLNQLGLNGVWFRPTYFSPLTSKFKGEMCEGVQIHVKDRKAIRPVDVGVNLLSEIYRQCPDKFEFLPAVKEGSRRMTDLLCGEKFSLDDWCSPEKILKRFHLESRQFSLQTKPYHLYE